MTNFNEIREDIKQKIINLYLKEGIVGSGRVPIKYRNVSSDEQVTQIKNDLINKLKKYNGILVEMAFCNGGYGCSYKIKITFNEFYINIWLSQLDYWSSIDYFKIINNKYTYFYYNEIPYEIKIIANIIIDELIFHGYEIIPSDILDVEVYGAKSELYEYKSEEEQPIPTIFNLIFSEIRI